jgi:nucleoside-diphosphate-sugar epimerase
MLEVRLHDVYTPGGSDLLSEWVLSVMRGGEPEPTDTIHHWVYHRDVENAIALLESKDVEGAFDLCGRRAWTQTMVVSEIETLWRRYQHALNHTHSIDSLSEVPSPAAVTYTGERRRPDLGPLHDALIACGSDGWRPMTAMRTGIMECIARSIEQV